jgi:hypothetical protein
MRRYFTCAISVGTSFRFEASAIYLAALSFLGGSFLSFSVGE